MSLKPQFQLDYLQVIKQFISAKVSEADAEGVVLGVSGGLDSAVVLKLATETLPADRISAVFLPEDTTPNEDAEHAWLIANSCKVELLEIRIDDILESYLKGNKILQMEPIGLGNLKARIRMNILYMIANTLNRLVLGTSNKSELLLGYFTKFGDGGSDVAPIGDLFKTQVHQLAKHLKIPNKIIEKPPTAGLIADQTDEEELGLDYETIDKILFGLDRDMSVKNIAKALGVKDEVVLGIKHRVESNRHKRKFAKIPKLGLKTIGVDLYE